MPLNPCWPSIGIDPNPCLLRWWNQPTEDHVFGNLGGMASVEQQRSSRWLQHFSTWNCPQRCILLLIISNLSWVIPTVVTPTVKLVQSLQVSEFPATFRRFSRPSFLPQTPPAPFLKGYQSSTCVHSHRSPTSKVPVEVPLDSLAHNQQDPRNDPKHRADPTAFQIFQISFVKTYANLTFERKTLQEILIIEMLARLRHLRKWNGTWLHGNIESSTSTTDPLTGDPNSTAFIGHGVVGVVGGTDGRLRRYIELRHHKFTSITSEVESLNQWMVRFSPVFLETPLPNKKVIVESPKDYPNYPSGDKNWFLKPQTQDGFKKKDLQKWHNIRLPKIQIESILEIASRQGL